MENENNNNPTPVILESVIDEKINELVNGEDLAGVSDGDKKLVTDVLKAVTDNIISAKHPLLNADGSIEMELMQGGVIKIKRPTGLEVMNAQREMVTRGEKGKPETMQHIYTMVCCADIDDEPMSFDDLSRLSGRDFNELTSLFKAINLQ